MTRLTHLLLECDGPRAKEGVASRRRRWRVLDPEAAVGRRLTTSGLDAAEWTTGLLRLRDPRRVPKSNRVRSLARHPGSLRR